MELYPLADIILLDTEGVHNVIICDPKGSSTTDDTDYLNIEDVDIIIDFIHDCKNA